MQNNKAGLVIATSCSARTAIRRNNTMDNAVSAPVEAAFVSQVTNTSTWEYPLDLHIAICNQLRINPKVWILPAPFGEFLGEHFPKSGFHALDAFADELGNICYFYDPDWTDDYCRWLVCHEMFHMSQYFDNGNMRGSRWEEFESEDEKEKYWEREANVYAAKTLGKRLNVDFRAYKSDTRPCKPKRGRKGKRVSGNDAAQKQDVHCVREQGAAGEGSVGEGHP